MLKLLAIGISLAALALADGTGAIAGRVIDPANGSGIPGVEVKITGATASPIDLRTDDSGNFRVSGLKEGFYKASFDKTGYYGTVDENGVFGHFGVAASATVRMDAQLHRFATLRGRVVDLGGNAVGGVMVSLIHGSSPGTEAVSDDNGRFVFAKLHSGAYLVLAKPSRKSSAEKRELQEYVPTYYPSITERSQAQWILLRSTDAAEYEIRMQSSPVFRIQGTVLDEAGKPAVKATVKLLGNAGNRIDPGPGSIQLSLTPGRQMFSMFPVQVEPRSTEANTVTDQKGSFEFNSVPAGEWRVQAQSEWQPSEREIESSGGQSLIVVGRNIDGLAIQLMGSFRLTVTDSAQGNTPQKPLQSPVLLIPLDGQPSPSGHGKYPLRYLDMIPGRYRVSAVLLPGQASYLTNAMLGSRDVLGQEVEFGPGSPPLRMVFKAGAGRVSGTMEKGAGVFVVLIPIASAHQLSSAGLVTITRCVSDTFEIGGLIPGDYAVAAFDRLDRELLATYEVLNSIVATAGSVRVEVNSSTVVDLHASPWIW